MPRTLSLQGLVAIALLAVSALIAPQVQAEAREQKVRLQVDRPEGAQCQVTAQFKGDHDNCKNDKADGRDECKKKDGCVCTRTEKHLAWEMKGKERFELRFDQGNSNPFVDQGEHKCDLKSNDKGKLRCRVKGKGVPKGTYRYSINVDGCKPAQAEFAIY
ncbi:MAG: hypothetical protein KDI09_10570 [Halioglobus sp.]|nr:hypothetical protein [Halioglobus sp.]